MAIIKELESSYGVSPSYHRVVCVSINALTKKVTICVSSYISKDARDKGCDAIDTLDIETPAEDYDLFLEDNIYKCAYKWLKDNVEGFEEAEDD